MDAMGTESWRGNSVVGGWWVEGTQGQGPVRRLLQSSGKGKGSGWRAGLQGGPGWGRQPLEVPWGRF